MNIMAGELRVGKVQPRKPQLHISAMEMKCPEAFRRRYMEKEIIPPGIAQIVGTGTHKGVGADLQHKVETGSLLTAEEVSDLARDGVNEAWEKSDVKLEPEEVELGIPKVKGQAVDKAVRLAGLHHIDKAPTIEPIHIERPWVLEINGYPLDLAGRIDIQEADKVRDTKTAAKTPAADCAEKSLQLKAYALAVRQIDGTAPASVHLDYLIDTATPKTATFSHEPNDEDFRAVLARVETMTLAIEKGVFVPVEPGHWCCHPKWCGYYRTCKYVRQPKQFAI